MDRFMDWFWDWTEKWVLDPLMVVMVAFLVFACVGAAIYGANRLVRGACGPTFPLVAESVRHTSEGTTLVMVGKVLAPIHHPEANWANVVGTYARTGGACMARINLTREQYMELRGEAQP